MSRFFARNSSRVRKDEPAWIGKTVAPEALPRLLVSLHAGMTVPLAETSTSAKNVSVRHTLEKARVWLSQQSLPAAFEPCCLLQGLGGGPQPFRASE